MTLLQCGTIVSLNAYFLQNLETFLQYLARPNHQQQITML